MLKHSVPLAQALITSFFNFLKILKYAIYMNLCLFSTFCKVSQEQQQQEQEQEQQQQQQQQQQLTNS